MANKVSNYVTPAGEKGDMDWKLTKNKVDPTSGQKIGGQENGAGKKSTVADGNNLKSLYNVTQKEPEKTGEPVLRPDAKRVETGEGDKKTTRGKEGLIAERETKFQEVKSQAKGLENLSKGDNAAKTAEKGLAADTARSQPATQKSAVANQQGIKAAPNQANAAVFAGVNTAKNAAANAKIAREAPRGETAPKTGHTKGGSDAGKDALVQKVNVQGSTVQQGNIGSQAGQAGAAASMKGPQKTTKPGEEVADKKDEGKEKTKTHGRQFAQAGAQLGEVVSGQGGMGSSTTTTSDQAQELEIVADRIDPDKIEGKSKLGIEFFSEETKATGIQLAAIEYRECIEQLLKTDIPIETKMKQWEQNKALIERVVGEDLGLARALIDAMRTRGKNAPGKAGWAA